MARINRFYLLIAALAFSKTYSADAATLEFPFTPVNVAAHCAKAYDNGDSSSECLTCVPFVRTDDASESWYDRVDGYLQNMGDAECPGETDCQPSGQDQYVAAVGDRTKYDGTGYYRCTESGWKRETCQDLVVFGGTFVNCCNAQKISSNQWTCDSYDRAYCNSGYYGTFNGKSTDCQSTSSCSDKIVYHGTFKNCCNPKQTGTTWSCSSYSSKFCNSGYYGTFNGKSTDCTACPDSSTEYAIAGSNGEPIPSGNLAHGESIAPSNTSKTSCYISKLGGSMGYIDGSGVYIFTNICNWSL